MLKLIFILEVTCVSVNSIDFMNSKIDISIRCLISAHFFMAMTSLGLFM